MLVGPRLAHPFNIHSAEATGHREAMARGIHRA